MAIELNSNGYERAIVMIKDGLEVEYDNDKDWNDVRATENDAVRYLHAHTLEEYGSWFLGINSDADAQDKSKYVYPFGDFNVLHKAALLDIKREAEFHKHNEILAAAKKLLEMIEYGAN